MIELKVPIVPRLIAGDHGNAGKVEQIVTGILINHIDDHFGSIRKTVGV